MSRSVFGWSYPPGVTQKMIDDEFDSGPACECDEIRRARHRVLMAEGLEDLDALDALAEEVANGDLTCEGCEEREREEHEVEDAAEFARLARMDDD